MLSKFSTVNARLHERQDGTLNIEGSVRYIIIHFPLAFPRIVFAGYLFDTPWGFTELLVVRLLATFRSGFARTTPLEGFVDAVLIRSLDTLGTGSYIRLLLHGAIRSGEGEGYGSTASTPEDNSKPSEDTFCEIFSRRWGPFSFQRLLRPLKNRLGQKIRLPATYLYRRPFSCLALMPAPP